MIGLRSRGLTVSPKLATGDGAMGFWKALAKVFPDTRYQRCLVHKTANVLTARSKSVQPKVKSELGEIWLSGGGIQRIRRSMECWRNIVTNIQQR
ncbi:hypothetical protein EWM60_04000 [Candidatus Erwinia dacicola]|nr:hypothetical protein [Candidatus Erwinia dacicola]